MRNSIRATRVVSYLVVVRYLEGRYEMVHCIPILGKLKLSCKQYTGVNAYTLDGRCIRVYTGVIVYTPITRLHCNI